MKFVDVLVAFVIFSSMLFLVGCLDSNDPSCQKIQVAKNKITLSSLGEYVGTLPDDRKIVRYEINRGDKTSHWIYVVDGSISINHIENKNANNVEVVIDGVIYVPKE